MESVELINEIEKLVFNGHFMKYIYKLYGEKNVLKAMHYLECCDIKRYQKLKAQIDINANKRKSESAKLYNQNQKFNFKNDIRYIAAKRIASGELNVNEGVMEYNLVMLNFLSIY